MLPGEPDGAQQRSSWCFASLAVQESSLQCHRGSRLWYKMPLGLFVCLWQDFLTASKLIPASPQLKILLPGTQNPTTWITGFMLSFDKIVKYHPPPSQSIEMSWDVCVFRCVCQHQVIFIWETVFNPLCGLPMYPNPSLCHQLQAPEASCRNPSFCSNCLLVSLWWLLHV